MCVWLLIASQGLRFHLRCESRLDGEEIKKLSPRSERDRTMMSFFVTIASTMSKFASFRADLSRACVESGVHIAQLI